MQLSGKVVSCSCPVDREKYPGHPYTVHVEFQDGYFEYKSPISISVGRTVYVEVTTDPTKLRPTEVVVTPVPKPNVLNDLKAKQEEILAKIKKDAEDKKAQEEANKAKK